MFICGELSRNFQMYNEQKANGAFRAGSTIDATDAIT